ncbi:MAG: hypothetical protein HZA01_03515 [Nitrospinae bacterium]|nr:hypothetical protein [Nitrospinota bacterium]
MSFVVNFGFGLYGSGQKKSRQIENLSLSIGFWLLNAFYLLIFLAYTLLRAKGMPLAGNQMNPLKKQGLLKIREGGWIKIMLKYIAK